MFVSSALRFRRSCVLDAAVAKLKSRAKRKPASAVLAAQSPPYNP